jgi:hypothetical protein
MSIASASIGARDGHQKNILIFGIVIFASSEELIEA